MPQAESVLNRLDWHLEVERNLCAITVAGKKLVADRIRCKNPGVELLLISQEAKLIRYVSRVYFLNTLNKGTDFPPLVDWLRYINISSTEILQLIDHVHTLPELAALNDKQILELCEDLKFSAESRRRLRKSSYGMKRYILRWKAEGVEPIRVFMDKDLAWMSFDRLTSNVNHRCCSESTLDSGNSDSGSGVGSNISQSSLSTSTPPPSPGIIVTSSSCKKIPTSLFISDSSRNQPVGLVRTPEDDCIKFGPNFSNTIDSLSRSHSHETNLLISPVFGDSSDRQSSIQSSRSINDCLSTINQASALSPPCVNRNITQFGTLPKSPKIVRTVHSIPHQWHKRKGFRIAAENCHFCQRQLSFLTEYEKCKSCKWKVHSQCKANIGDSCGLTPDYLKRALQEMFLKDSARDGWTPTLRPSTSHQTFAFDSVDSSSSTNSSTPSTPAFPPFYSATIPVSTSPFLIPGGNYYQNDFVFPDSLPEIPDIIVDAGQNENQHLISSEGSDCTMQSDGANQMHSSNGTLIIDSLGSNYGQQNDFSEDINEYQVQLSPSNCSLNRDRWSNGTIRVPNSWNDITIPFCQIEFRRQSLIGKGRFGEVHKAYWFGDVAVKFLNMDHVDEGKQLEAFKAEVASFKNTRHDNIVLFMGYCLDQHKLGVVMYYCKGRSLHHAIHESGERFDFAQTVNHATQICQGLSYLHTKKIIHKDLRTKNIFVENRNRIVITDFGLFSMKRLAQPSRNHTLIVPEYWLSYLSPELIKYISSDLNQLSFSEKSDVFAFGTVWYELMANGFPFEQTPSDSVIWQVGRGMKGALNNVNATREVKEILIRCWSYAGEDRPSFKVLQDMLERLPKKRLNRSPSFPVSRSYESMF